MKAIFKALAVTAVAQASNYFPKSLWIDDVDYVQTAWASAPTADDIMLLYNQHMPKTQSLVQ